MNGFAILSRLCSALALANPLGFLDRWLLRKHPLVWRTGIIHAGWYIGLFWLLASTAGRLLPFSEMDPPTLATLASWNRLMFVLIFVAIALWIFSMARRPLVSASRSVVILTFAALWAAIYLALTAPSVFSTSILPRIAVLGDDWDFDAHVAALEPINYGVCFFGEIGEERLSRAESAALHYGIVVEPEWTFCRFAHGNAQCYDWRHRCLRLSRAGKTVGVTALAERMMTVREARLHRDESAEAQPKVKRLLSLTTLVVSLVAAGVATALTFRRSRPTASDGVRREIVSSIHRVVGYMPGWMRRWDHRLLKSRPVIWAMRTHVVVLASTFIAVTLIGGGAAAWPYAIQGEVLGAVVIVGCLAAGMLSVIISTSYQRRFALTLDSSDVIGRALLANFVPYAPAAIAVLTMLTVSLFRQPDHSYFKMLIWPSILFFYGAIPAAIVAATMRFIRLTPAIILFVFISLPNLWLIYIGAPSEAIFFAFHLVFWFVLLGFALQLRAQMPVASRMVVFAFMYSIPWLAIFLGFPVTEVLRGLYVEYFVGDPRNVLDFFFGLRLQGLAALAALVVSTIIILGFLMRPLYPILVEMQVKPKAE